MKEMLFKFFGVLSQRTFLFLSLLPLVVITAYGQGRPAIRVSSEAAIERERIELGRIARITGDPAASERLKNVSLGYSPAIGLTREILRNQIQLAINAAGFADGEFILDSPPKVSIRRASQTITTDQIRVVVTKVLMDQFKTGGVAAQIERLDLPEGIQVPVGSVDIHTSVAGVRNLFERFSIPVEIRIDNKVFRTFVATVEISAFADVLVATSDLVVNRMINYGDVRTARCRIVKPLTEYLHDKDNLHGMQLIKPVQSGQPLTSDAIAAGFVIKYGDPVRIEARSGLIKISIAGESRSQGRIGDRIAVRNTQSGAIVQAIILGEGLVKVTF